MKVMWSYCFMTVLLVMILNPLLLLISERLSILSQPVYEDGYRPGVSRGGPRPPRRVNAGYLQPDSYYTDEEDLGDDSQVEGSAPEPIMAGTGRAAEQRRGQNNADVGLEIGDGLVLDNSWQGPRYGVQPALSGEMGPALSGSLLGRDVQPRSDGARSMVAWKPAVVRHEGLYWAFFTQYNPTFGEPWFLQGWINLAVSQDMDTWHMRGTALPALSKPDWLSGRVLSASALSVNGNLHLYYSATSIVEPSVERVGLAVLETNSTTWKRLPLKAVRSKDGYQRQVAPLVEPDPHWYDTLETVESRPQHHKYKGHVQWRDPFVVGPVKTRYYMFVTAACAELSSPWRGCIGLATAKDPLGPWEVQEPALIALLPEEDRIDGQLESMFYEMERPCVFKHHGQWHMLVSSPIINRNPRWKAARLVENRGARLFHFVSDMIQGPYEPFNREAFPQVQDSARTGMYGTMVVPAPPEERQTATRGHIDDDEDLLVIGSYDVRKHPGGKSIRHEMHGTLEVSHRYRLDWPNSHTRPALAGMVPFGWKIDTYDMES